MTIPIQHPKKDVTLKNNIWLFSIDVAPVAGTVLLDTGPLVEGSYTILTTVLNTVLTASRCAIEHRDAAGVLTLNRVFIGFRRESNQTIFDKFLLATNESIRVRITNNTGGVVYSSMQYAQTG